MSDKRLQRLEEIKLKMIQRCLSEINTDSKYDTYDAMLYETFISGKFDDAFLSDNLKDLDRDKRDEVMALARKYNSLCFYRGEFDNWADSIEGVTKSDYDLISIKLLDNFDYLMRLAKSGGEDVFKLLDKCRISDNFQKSAVISKLRPGISEEENSKGYDDILETILVEMSKSDGLYKDFSDTQKVIMLDNLDGVIYRKTEDKQYELLPVDELKKRIIEEYGEDEGYPVKAVDSETFSYIIGDIYSSYQTAALKR